MSQAYTSSSPSSSLTPPLTALLCEPWRRQTRGWPWHEGVPKRMPDRQPRRGLKGAGRGRGHCPALRTAVPCHSEGVFLACNPHWEWIQPLGIAPTHPWTQALAPTTPLALFRAALGLGPTGHEHTGNIDSCSIEADKGFAGHPSRRIAPQTLWSGDFLPGYRIWVAVEIENNSAPKSGSQEEFLPE